MTDDSLRQAFLDLIDAARRGDRVADRALRHHWIDAAGRIILRRLVAQAALCLSMEEQLRAHRAAGTVVETYAKLAKQHSDTAKQTESLLASLRATPRSRSTSHAAGLQTRKTAEMRPWEIRSGRRVETQTGDE